MKQVYTIQNEHGDKGFIQVIDEDCIVHDEVMGGSYPVEPENYKCFLVISKEEYDIIKNLHEMINETGMEEYLTMVNTMIDLTIDRNKKKFILGGIKMATSKSDINESYQELLRQLVNAKEQMKDFMDMVSELEGQRHKITPEGELKFAVQGLEMSLYSRLRDFLEDMTLSTSSSDIQNHIDNLPDDETEDED